MNRLGIIPKLFFAGILVYISYWIYNTGQDRVVFFIAISVFGYMSIELITTGIKDIFKK